MGQSQIDTIKQELIFKWCFSCRCRRHCESSLMFKFPGARSSKVPKLFGRILGNIILLVSSKRRRLEARNLTVILIFQPFAEYEETSFTEWAGQSFTNGFSVPKCFGTFDKPVSGPSRVDSSLYPVG